MNIYKDSAKLIELANATHKIGDGVTTTFTFTYKPLLVFVDGIKRVDFEIVQSTVLFESPPAAGLLITFLGENTLDFYLDASQADEQVESIYIDTDADFWLSSENIVSDSTGELLFSTDNVTFYSCIQILTGTDILIYVKASLAAAVDKISSVTDNRIIALDSSLPLNSSGEILVSFTVDGGDIGGVEIYETYA